MRWTWRHRDGTASSREWLVVPGAKLPPDRPRFLEELDRAYYSWIERVTAGLVRIERGEGIRARVEPFGWPVGLELGPARIEGGRIARPILSGWLVAAGSGTLGLALAEVPGGVEAAVEVEGFRPRLLALPFGDVFYPRAQVVIHRRLSVSFLRQEVVPRLSG